MDTLLREVPLQGLTDRDAQPARPLHNARQSNDLVSCWSQVHVLYHAHVVHVDQSLRKPFLWNLWMRVVDDLAFEVLIAESIERNNGA